MTANSLKSAFKTIAGTAINPVLFPVVYLGFAFAIGSAAANAQESDASDVGAEAQGLRSVETVIDVRPVIELERAQSEITLGDLVNSPRLSLTARDYLKSVALADAPRAGETRAFTDNGLRDVFDSAMRAIEGKTGERLMFRLPSRVTITRKRLLLTSNEIGAKLEAHFRTLCADCDFEISNLNLPSISSGSSDGIEWSLRLRDELPKGGFSIPLEVVADSGAKRTYWISGHLIVRREVPVAARAISIGEKLQPEDIVMSKKDVTFATDIAPTEGDFASSIAGRSIAAGQIVWRSSLRRELALRHGDAVKVSAGTDAWQISIDGIAQSGGYVGDLVKVKIPRTQKIISGVLKEKGVIEVR